MQSAAQPLVASSQHPPAVAVSNETVSIQSVSKAEPSDQTRQRGDDLPKHTATDSMHQIKSSEGVQNIASSSKTSTSQVQRQKAEPNHPTSDAGASLAEEAVVEADRHSIEQQGASQADRQGMRQQGELESNHHSIEQQGALQADRNSIEQQVAELEHRLGPGDWTRLVVTATGFDERLVHAAQELASMHQPNAPTAGDLVSRRCKDILRQFPTSMAQDITDLQQGTLSANVQLALQYRLHKKQILHQACTAAQSL